MYLTPLAKIKKHLIKYSFLEYHMTVKSAISLTEMAKMDSADSSINCVTSHELARFHMKRGKFRMNTKLHCFKMSKETVQEGRLQVACRRTWTAGCGSACYDSAAIFYITFLHAYVCLRLWIQKALKHTGHAYMFTWIPKENGPFFSEWTKKIKWWADFPMEPSHSHKHTSECT